MWCFSFVASFVISVTFRALAPNGVLLYATNDLQNPTHFISLELVNGRLVFKYNAGYKTVRVTTTLRSYADDGLEYTVNTVIHSFTTPAWGRGELDVQYQNLFHAVEKCGSYQCCQGSV